MVAVPQPGAAATVAPFTLVIELDAWNIRERDGWGQTAAWRAKDKNFSRWHWVYTGTCFQLSQRVIQGKQRAVILERSYVATRQGIPELMQRLHYEAQRRGLAYAERVLVIADGAVWIWNAVTDRFAQAVQRLDLFHANTYLWAVAGALHGEGTSAARKWVKPLLQQVRQDQVAQVIQHLTELTPTLTTAGQPQTTQAIAYFTNNQDRMRYPAGKQRGEPLGSGAIESTCRQLQCRLKRPGQFWSTAGDEALLTLECCWRNDQWEQLFPHARLTSVARN